MVTLFNPLLTLEYPQCHKGKICYLAPGRNCIGYDIHDTENLNSSDFLWIQQQHLKISIIKRKVTYDEAIQSCKRMCAKLWLPKSEEFDDTYNIFSQTCYEHNIEKVFIGASGIKLHDSYYFKYLDDPSTVVYSNQSKFMDMYLDGAMNLFDIGEYPLTIQTTGNRFNYWSASDSEMENYYACTDDRALSNDDIAPIEMGIYNCYLCFLKQ